MKTVVSVLLIAMVVTASTGTFMIDCSESPDGLYAIGECEPRFLTCSGGIARIMDCPADLMYHGKEEICDWRHNIKACRGLGEIEASGDADASGEGSGNASGDGSGYEDEESSTAISEEASGDEVLQNVCEGRDDGVYHSGKCTNYYFICASNSPRFLSCTTPLFYDPAEEKCTWIELIEECKKGMTLPVTEETEDDGSGYRSREEESSGEGSGQLTQSCDGLADGIYPIDECSTDFLTCSGGIARVMDCPSSLFFNPTLLVCDWQRNVAGCSGRVETTPKCEADGFFSFGQCASSFTACTNGHAIIMFCPSGLRFSQSTQMCDYERNVSECGEASGEEASGNGYGYEEQDSKLTPCVHMENGLYALECTPRVLSCQNGKEEIFECPSNLVFNEKSLICDYPETTLKCQLEDTLLIRDSAVATYNCEVDGLFSNTLCSRDYHKCTNGQLVNHECADSNAVFSAIHGECVDASSLQQCQ